MAPPSRIILPLVIAIIAASGSFDGRTTAQTAAQPAKTSCERLAALALPNASITSTQSVLAGDWQRVAGERVERNLPAFCRVTVTLTPSVDSAIHMEVWLPASTWNGRLQAAGGNAINYASDTDAVQTPGSIEPASGMLRALRAGYATSSTAKGQTVADEAYRAVHEMTLKAKTIIQAFYGKPPLFSYFNGCSHGGGQGTMAAHRFPADYYGIIAGAPGTEASYGFRVRGLWWGKAILEDPAGVIPPASLRFIHDAVVRACDAIDDVQDGLIDDPRRCRFDPETLLCQGTNADTCLTAAQVKTVSRLLNPITNPRTGALIYPGLEPGSELGWAKWTTVRGSEPRDAGPFKSVLNDPAWNWRTMDLARDVAQFDKWVEAHQTNALDPDLSAFANRGGKLLIYQGWSDMTNAPQSTINYYDKVRSLIGEAAASTSVRLFMAPGMGHCGYGEGPNIFDGIGALTQWVEHGRAPDQMTAGHYAPGSAETDGKFNRTRPLCPYPQVARYNGKGSTDDAANFLCRKP